MAFKKHLMADQFRFRLGVCGYVFVSVVSAKDVYLSDVVVEKL